MKMLVRGEIFFFYPLETLDIRSEAGYHGDFDDSHVG